MTRMSRLLFIALMTSCATVALAQGNPPPKEPILISRDPDWIDLTEGRAEMEKWRAEQQAELRRQGRATAEEFRKIDVEMVKRAKMAEVNRTMALESLSKKAGIPIEQGPGGTHPQAEGGRGSFSDIDTRSMSPKEYQQVLETARKNGYTVEAKGDSFTIKELDVTVHRQGPTETAPVGSSGRDLEIGRGQNKETAMGMGRNDPAVSVSDNLKKGAHTLNQPPEVLGQNPAELQKLGKMTERNIAETSKVATSGNQPANVDPVTKSQAEMLKQGYSPEAAGIVRDNATPEQRTQDIADFQKRAKGATIDAVRAADTHAAGQMDKLAGEVRSANDALETAKTSGDPAKVAEARAKVDAANKAVVDYHQVRTGAHEAAVVNDPDAAKIVNEARGVSNEGKSPSEVREAAVAQDRKALTQAAADPAKSPAPKPDPAAAPDPAKAPAAGEGPAAKGPAEPAKTPVAGEPSKAPTSGEPVKGATAEGPVKGAAGAEPVKGPGAGEPVKGPGVGEPVKGPGAGEPVKGPGAAEGGVKATAMKGANAALGAYAIYHGVKRGAEEAGKEAAEQGDGAIKSTVKTVGYSAWYGLGIGGAIETGKKAGEDSAKQWEKDVKEGKVDPNSKLSQAWAHIRGVGWGVAEFTGLQAIKDATVEGAGYVKDRYGQYKSEKAEADAKAAKGDKPADKPATPAADGKDKTTPPAAGDKPKPDASAADKTKAGDGKDKTAGADGKPADKTPADKAAADKATADKAAADKLAAEKAAADKASADKAAADKAAADKAAADKARRDKDKPVGGAIGAAGVKDVKQPPKPLPPVTQPVVAPPPPPPPPPTTTEVEGGWVKDKNGMTKVIYINDANGNRIGGYYVKYDANGREIGRETFTEKPTPPEPPPASLDGTYSGRISGGSSGSLTITVRGGQVSGTIGGVHEGDPIHATFSASVGADGSFSASASGTLRTTWSDGKTSSYGFTGRVSGKVNGRSGSGSWSGGNTWGSSKGTWQASK